MKISVIMPVFNGQDTVVEAIESILNQTFFDFEFIIINDGSTDNTSELVRHFQARDKRIILLEQQNCGLTASLNRAIQTARGEYIARQDADDVSLPERFKYQLSLLEREKDIGFAGSSYGMIDKSGRLFDFGYIRNSPSDILRRLKAGNIFCHGSIMLRGNVLKEAGGYRAFFKYAQDYDLYLRLIGVSLPGAVNKVLYYRRVLLGSISITKYHLQSAYALLARECYEERLAGKNDASLLNDKCLSSFIRHSGSSNLLFVFLEALYCVRDDNIKKSREIIRDFLLPIRLKKWKFYLLWAFSYFPEFLRRIAFELKTNIRRIKPGFPMGTENNNVV